MITLPTSSKKSAIVSCILTLPFITLFLCFYFRWEPNLGSLVPLIGAENGHVGSLVLLGMLVLMLVGLMISIHLIVKTRQAGMSLSENRLNIIISIIIVFIFLMLASAIIIDQYPGWMGVPNCD